MAFGNLQDIGTSAAFQCIITQSTAQGINAGLAPEVVIPRAANKAVIPEAAIDRVTAAAAINDIIATAAKQRIRTACRLNTVVTGTRIKMESDGIITRNLGNPVIAC